MDIKRIGSQPSSKVPDENFTGTVRVDPLFEAPEPARVRGASVTFEPGARTAWHTHPLGQTLIVTGGCSWVQRWGGPIVAPVIGATKISHLESAVESLAVKLTSEEMAFLEEPYVPHGIVGHS